MTITGNNTSSTNLVRTPMKAFPDLSIGCELVLWNASPTNRLFSIGTFSSRIRTRPSKSPVGAGSGRVSRVQMPPLHILIHNEHCRSYQSLDKPHAVYAQALHQAHPPNPKHVIQCPKAFVLSALPPFAQTTNPSASPTSAQTAAKMVTAISCP